MSVNKIHLIRETIIGNLKNTDFLDSIAKTEILILDTWSSNFLDNMDKETQRYQKMRSDFIKNPDLTSPDLDKLSRLSNIYINLKVDNNDIDVLLAKKVLEISDDQNVSREYIIEKIDNILAG
jgi:hypothetical protein